MKKARQEIRLTIEEKIEIKELAENLEMSVSEFILYSTLKKSVKGWKKAHEYTTALSNYLRELNKIGVNYNQQVKAINKIKRKKGDLNVAEIILFQNQFEEFLREFKDLKRDLIRLLLNLSKDEL